MDKARVASQDGFSVMHLIVAMLLGSIAAAALAVSLHDMGTIARRGEEAATQIRRAILLDALLEQIMLDLDSSRLALLPRVHGGGALSYADGTPVSYSGFAAHPPDPASDAVSSLRLMPGQLLTVVSCSETPSGIELTACAIGAGSIARESEFIALSPDGLAPLRGSREGLDACSRYRLTAMQSLAARTPERAACGAGLLFPVEEQYALYVSTGGTLRKIFFDGGMPVSSQPVAENVAGLRLAVSLPRGQGLYCLSAGIKTFTAQSTKCSRLSRRTGLSLLLNL